MIISITILFAACTKVTELTIIPDETTQEEDAAALEELLTEIKNLAESETCENAENWKFTAVGKKACGGPTGYIAYSKKIDVANFLELVDTYTKAMDDFNIKWNIFSTCEVMLEPLNISCENGKAVLSN